VYVSAARPNLVLRPVRQVAGRFAPTANTLVDHAGGGVRRECHHNVHEIQRPAAGHACYAHAAVIPGRTPAAVQLVARPEAPAIRCANTARQEVDGDARKLCVNARAPPTRRTGQAKEAGTAGGGVPRHARKAGSPVPQREKGNQVENTMSLKTNRQAQRRCSFVWCVRSAWCTASRKGA